MEDSIQLHHRDLETTIQQAVRKYHADPQRIFLLAFSQACSLNYRYVFTHPRAIRGAVSVCGGVPGDWNENPHYRSAATHVLHIAARQDEWYSREKNLEFRRQLGTCRHPRFPFLRFASQIPAQFHSPHPAMD